MIVGVDGMTLQNYGCFAICHLIHDYVRLNMAHTNKMRKNAEVKLKCFTVPNIYFATNRVCQGGRFSSITIT